MGMTTAIPLARRKSTELENLQYHLLNNSHQPQLDEPTVHIIGLLTVYYFVDLYCGYWQRFT